MSKHKYALYQQHGAICLGGSNSLPLMIKDAQRLWNTKDRRETIEVVCEETGGTITAFYARNRWEPAT